jgi:hypothetical protein
VCTGFWWGGEGKRPLGRPRRRWEDNIKIDFQNVGGGCGDWMELAQDRDRWRALVSTAMDFLKISCIYTGCFRRNCNYFRR